MLTNSTTHFFLQTSWVCSLQVFSILTCTIEFFWCYFPWGILVPTISLGPAFDCLVSMRKQSPLSPAAAKSLRMHSQRWMLMVDSRVGISVPCGKCVRETHHPLTPNCSSPLCCLDLLGGLSLQVLLVDSLSGRKFGTESSIWDVKRSRKIWRGVWSSIFC